MSTNHKCIQPCYFPLLLKPTAQKRKMVWNSSMSSSRLVLPQLHIPVNYGAFHCSSFMRVTLVFEDNTYVIIILYS
jgi:hypothetical protein